MKNHNIPTPTCILKVAIKCCTKCQQRAMERLRKIKGVDSANYDAKHGMVTVLGDVNPDVLIDKFAKWGKKAELCSLEKDLMQGNSCSNKKNCATHVKTDCDHVEFGSDFDDDKNDLTWEHPNLKSKQTTKNGKKSFWDFLGNKNGGSKLLDKISMMNANATKKWHFPRTPVPPPSKAPRPFYPPPYQERPNHRSHPFGPMMPPSYHGSMMPPYYGSMLQPPPPPPAPGYGPHGPHSSMMPPYYGSMLQPPPPPPAPGYGPHGLHSSMMPPYYGSMLQPPPPVQPSYYGHGPHGPHGSFYRPRPPPKVNPMTHYTSYEDNYRLYP